MRAPVIYHTKQLFLETHSIFDSKKIIPYKDLESFISTAINNRQWVKDLVKRRRMVKKYVSDFQSFVLFGSNVEKGHFFSRRNKQTSMDQFRKTRHHCVQQIMIIPEIYPSIKCDMDVDVLSYKLKQVFSEETGVCITTETILIQTII